MFWTAKQLKRFVKQKWTFDGVCASLVLFMARQKPQSLLYFRLSKQEAGNEQAHSWSSCNTHTHTTVNYKLHPAAVWRCYIVLFRKHWKFDQWCFIENLRRATQTELFILKVLGDQFLKKTNWLYLFWLNVIKMLI